MDGLWVVGCKGGLQPQAGPTCIWEEFGGTLEPRPTLVYFQVRSRDISIEEWKGSETYNPNTAYGKTLALTPPAEAEVLGPSPQGPATASWPGSLSPCPLLSYLEAE